MNPMASAFQFLYGGVIDCLDPLFFLVLLGAGLAAWNERSRRFVSIPLTLALVVGGWECLPPQALSNGVLFHALLWTPAVALSLLFIFRRPVAPNDDHLVHASLSRMLDVLMPILGATATWLWVFPPVPLTYSSLHRLQWTGLAVVGFYAMYNLSPWRWLPARVRQGMGSFGGTLALGWFLLRAMVWGYTAFQASVHSPYISFRMDGPVNAVAYTRRWNFPRLERWITETQWMPKRSLEQETGLTPREVELLIQGAREAEQFRRSLLTPLPDGALPARLIVQAILQFPSLVQDQLEDRPNLDDFALEEEYLLAALEGRSNLVDGVLAFGDFTGKWYGRWDRMVVDHDWKDVQSFEPSFPLHGEPFLCLRALQYAWIGDGFGWNLLAAPLGHNNLDVILGTVYHVEDHDPARLRSHQPHVGISLNQGQLIWITPEDVFLEEILLHKERQKERYAITGFHYAIQDNRLTTPQGAFQAVYTRDPLDRPDWISISISLSIAL